MLYPLAAGGYNYRPLKRGVAGWDVVALQECLVGWKPELALSFDGVFGPQTEASVKTFQRASGLTADGIAGILTQRALALALLWPSQAKYSTPAGLGRGIIEGESGYQVGAYSRPYSDGSRDAGLTQEHIHVDDAQLKVAFDGKAAIGRLAANLRANKDAAQADGQRVRSPLHSRTVTDEGAWKYGAVLRHNWPAASAHYVAGDIDTWEYEATYAIAAEAHGDQGRFVKWIDEGHQQRAYRMSQVAQWVALIGVAGVDTGFEWAEHYVASKSLYVEIWTP